MTYKLEEENGIWFAAKPGEPKIGFMGKDDAQRWIDYMEPKMEYKVLPEEPKPKYTALKKLLLEHHNKEMKGSMGGSAICYCGAGMGRTDACADFGQLLDIDYKYWNLTR